jgi:hypothetical protein
VVIALTVVDVEAEGFLLSLAPAMLRVLAILADEDIDVGGFLFLSVFFFVAAGPFLRGGGLDVK